MRAFSTPITILFVSVCSVLFLLTACGGDEYVTEDGAILHPVPDSIPYHDQPQIPVDGERSIAELDQVPAPLSALASYLEHPYEVDMRELNTHAKSPTRFDVASFDGHRLVMLDAEEDRFFEYDLDTDEYVQLAEQGEGPGDIFQPMDMKRFGDAVYVGDSPFRISRFDCSSAPCTFDAVTNVDDFLNASAPVSDTEFVFLATVEFPGEEHVPGAEHAQGVLRLVDAEGNELRAFGSAYQSEAYMVTAMMLMNAMLEYSPQAGRYALLYRGIPHLFSYDDAGELAASFELDPDFEPAYRYSQNDGNWGFGHNERNPMVWFYAIGTYDEFVLITRLSAEAPEEDSGDATYRYDYHAIDLLNDVAYHVGTDEYVGSYGRLIYPTEAGLLLNDGGSLYFSAF